MHHHIQVEGSLGQDASEDRSFRTEPLKMIPSRALKTLGGRVLMPLCLWDP
jgi:hypothetical protein